MIRYCLHCDDGRVLAHERRDAAVRHRDPSDSVSGILGWHCPVCSEIEFAEGERDAIYSAALEDLAAQVDAKEAARLRDILRRLKLTQRDAAQLTDGGHNAFSRFERGGAKLVSAAINLFRLLDKHPELLAELQNGD